MPIMASGIPVKKLVGKLSSYASSSLFFTIKQEIGGGDIMFPMSYFNDIEKDRENAEVVGIIEQKLIKVVSQQSHCGIDRVPSLLLNENPAAYIPHRVSIGPFYHDKQHLQPMEARKMQYLKDFLGRGSPGKLKDYVKVMIDLVERAFQCYPDVKIERKSFVMMMAVDGCFILELLLREPNSESDAKWISLVLVDLILLENQLPFFVLEALYQVFIKDSDHEAADKCSVNGFICRKYVPQILRLLLGKDTISSSRDIEQMEPKHLLDLVRQFLIPPKQKATNGKKSEQESVGSATKCLHFAPLCNRHLCFEDTLKEDNVGVRIQCATELEKGSIKFKKNKKPTSLLDIRFDIAKGVLTIPGITNHSTEIILRNLIAYEQFIDDYSYITEYAAFLDSLIDSYNDVRLLQKEGILDTIFGDTKKIARFFTNLVQHAAVPLYYTFPVHREMEQYYNKPWHKWKASLIMDHFNTPWALISVVVAIILLVLMFIQTFYTALPYIK